MRRYSDWLEAARQEHNFEIPKVAGVSIAVRRHKWFCVGDLLISDSPGFDAIQETGVTSKGKRIKGWIAHDWIRSLDLPSTLRYLPITDPNVEEFLVDCAKRITSE